jgi:hypothetical protein
MNYRLDFQDYSDIDYSFASVNVRGMDLLGKLLQYIGRKCGFS